MKKITIKTAENIIMESNLHDKEKSRIKRLIDEGVLIVSDADLPLFEYWLNNEQLDSYRPLFYGGYTPERFQKEHVDQMGYEIDLEDRQWYTVLPSGIIEYYDEPGWWKR